MATTPRDTLLQLAEKFDRLPQRLEAKAWLYWPQDWPQPKADGHQLSWWYITVDVPSHVVELLGGATPAVALVAYTQDAEFRALAKRADAAMSGKPGIETRWLNRLVRASLARPEYYESEQFVYARPDLSINLQTVEAYRAGTLSLEGPSRFVAWILKRVSPPWPLGITFGLGLVSALVCRQAADAMSQKTATNTPTRRKHGGPEPKRDLIIAALCEHHQYESSSGPNLEPIGVNELARKAKVSAGAVSKFFKTEFRGHKQYKHLCRYPDRLAYALKMLNGDLKPCLLLTNPGSLPDREEKD